MTGLAAKEPKARRKVGLIVMLPMAKADISLAVVDQVRKERSIPPVALPRAHARREAEANHGVRKLKKEVRKNEINKHKT